MSSDATPGNSRIISPAAYTALSDALAVVFWNKTPFERYLRRWLRDHPELLFGVSFKDVKRRVADELVDRLMADEARYQRLTLGLMLDVADMESFPNLARQDDSEHLLWQAREAVENLRRYTAKYAAEHHERDDFERELTEGRWRCAALVISEAGGVVAAELVQLAADVTPYVTAAAGAYGGAVLTKAKDEAAGATVELGRRLLQKIFGRREPGDEVLESIADVIADPTDADNLAALRKAVRKALEADETLATDVRAMLSEVRVGDHSNVVTGSHVEGNVIQIGSVDGGVHINDDR